ncbi:phasin family protein [Halorhodospira halophila]|uniref:Phasin family protein n=1 Tax=Halorhodospira halophila (strain DSM 244 / SL1) TaxID=349124 RepID=A1WYK0_HALHL|nr:phasin family protein [Halorhodospira halophila]ABM62762.1 phasin family protein [Halorhodospira halophila SL1]MBK1728115.1 phasin family protein [Halorhodospira halophila]
MQDQLNKSMQQFQKMMEPSRKLNALLLEHAEKVAHLNLEAARSYTDLAMEQMRKAMEVRDPESFQSYLNDQGKVVQTMSNKLTENASTLADISKNMGEEVQKIAQENVSALTETMQGQAEKASGKGRSAGSSAGSSASAGSSSGSAASGSSKKSA